MGMFDEFFTQAFDRARQAEEAELRRAVDQAEGDSVPMAPNPDPESAINRRAASVGAMQGVTMPDTPSPDPATAAALMGVSPQSEMPILPSQSLDPNTSIMGSNAAMQGVTFPPPAERPLDALSPVSEGASQGAISAKPASGGFMDMFKGMVPEAVSDMGSSFLENLNRPFERLIPNPDKEFIVGKEDMSIGVLPPPNQGPNINVPVNVNVVNNLAGAARTPGMVSTGGVGSFLNKGLKIGATGLGLGVTGTAALFTQPGRDILKAIGPGVIQDYVKELDAKAAATNQKSPEQAALDQEQIMSRQVIGEAAQVDVQDPQFISKIFENAETIQTPGDPEGKSLGQSIKETMSDIYGIDKSNISSEAIKKADKFNELFLTEYIPELKARLNRNTEEARQLRQACANPSSCTGSNQIGLLIAMAMPLIASLITGKRINPASVALNQQLLQMYQKEQQQSAKSAQSGQKAAQKAQREDLKDDLSIMRTMGSFLDKYIDNARSTSNTTDMATKRTFDIDRAYDKDEAKRLKDAAEIEGEIQDEQEFTEAQGKALKYFAVMDNANRELLQLEKSIDFRDPKFLSQNWDVRDFLPVVDGKIVIKLPEVFKGPEAQIYYRALKSLVNADLRDESGAAIPIHEKPDKIAEIMPSFGDHPETVAAKREARLRTISTLRTKAGGEPAIKAYKQSLLVQRYGLDEVIKQIDPEAVIRGGQVIFRAPTDMQVGGMQAKRGQKMRMSVERFAKLIEMRNGK